MKSLYKIMLFLVILQVVVLMVNSLSIFPNTFYSDVDEPTGDSIWDKATYYLTPASNDWFNSVSATALVGLFILAGIGAGAVTHSPVYPSLVFVIYISVNMMLNSFGFFRRLFTNWDIESMEYLGLALGIGIVVIIIITVVEMPTHGRSGS